MVFSSHPLPRRPPSWIWFSHYVTDHWNLAEENWTLNESLPSPWESGLPPSIACPWARTSVSRSARLPLSRYKYRWVWNNWRLNRYLFFFPQILDFSFSFGRRRKKKDSRLQMIYFILLLWKYYQLPSSHVPSYKIPCPKLPCVTRNPGTPTPRGKDHLMVGEDT